MDVLIATESYDNFLNNGLNLNISIDYNGISATNISPRPGLWNIMVWMTPYSNGSQPRWSVVEQVLTRNQSSQGFIAGQHFVFTDVIYRPNQQELEVYLVGL